MVPDDVIQVGDIPRTINGKKLEIPVRRILLGEDPLVAFNPDSLKNPESMKFFIEFARRVRR
jgi:acetoacetyl-CoA synthetase